MTDRELLEMAAKACGWQVIWYGTKSEIAPINTHGGASGTRWNPLTDDGDALRLAVKLEMHIMLFGPMTTVQPKSPSQTGFVGFDERHNDDPYAATRRAIVRAAAEIGKEMK